MLLLTTFLFPLGGHGQILNEDSRRSTVILPVEEKEVPGLLLPKNTANPFLKNNPFTDTKETTDPKNTSNNPSPTIENDEKFLDPGAYYLSKLNRSNKEGENKQYGSKINQYLGDVRNNGTFVEVIFRDHETPDGDRIKILVNDKIVVPDVILLGSFRSANIDLTEGFNKIDFVALNQGSSGPNTAEVRIYDDTGGLLASNRWNLATGVKATYIVVKE